MIKLSSILDSIKMDMEMDIHPNGGFDGWTDDDDTNMNDEEWDEFQSDLNEWLDEKRIKKLTNQLIDINDLVIDFILMDEDNRKRLPKMSDKERDKISRILHQKRLDGKTCSLWKNVGIKYLGDKGLWSKMLDWETQYYNDNHRTLNED